MRNYSSVLEEVGVGKPVYLTKNGRGKYAIVDISELEEYERMKAELQLMHELEKGRLRGETEGWISTEDVREHFKKKNNV